MNKEDVKLSKVAKFLILDQSLGKVISIFLDVFFAAYFYKISERNVFYLAIYNIIGWLIATIGALLFANSIKTRNKVKLYRFGIIIKSLYICLIIVLGNKITKYIYIIGIMYGITTATTGFPFNMIESESISNKERSKYIGYAAAITEIVGIIVPILLGAYITIKSYKVAAILILIISILKIFICFEIKNKNNQIEKVSLKEFFNIYKQDATLKKIYLIEFFKGINRYGVMSLVVSLLIIYQTNNELELGGWTSLFSIFTIIAMYLFGKFYNNNRKSKLLSLSLVATLISFCVILYKINIFTAIIYNIVYYVFINIVLKITEINLFNYSNKEPFKSKYNTEYFIFREIFLNIGRILGYTILLVFIGITGNLAYLNILFTVIILSIIIVILMSNKLNIDRL